MIISVFLEHSIKVIIFQITACSILEACTRLIIRLESTIKSQLKLFWFWFLSQSRGNEGSKNVKAIDQTTTQNCAWADWFLNLISYFNGIRLARLEFETKAYSRMRKKSNSYIVFGFKIRFEGQDHHGSLCVAWGSLSLISFIVFFSFQCRYQGARC